MNKIELYGCKFLSALFMFFIIIHELCAQDPAYSIYWNDRTYLNPALSGSDKGLYIATQYRRQWPKIISKFETYSVAADVFEPNLSGGLGLRILQTSEGEGYQKTTEFGIIYSYIIPIKSKRSDLTFALGSGLFNRSINASKLIFSDQIDPVNGYIYPTEAEIDGIGSIKVANFNAGVSFRSYISSSSYTFYSLGFSAWNITQPNITLTNQTSRLPIRYSAHIDITTPINRLSGRFIFHVKPAALVVIQKGITGMNHKNMRVGLNLVAHPVSASVFYKNETFEHFNTHESLITSISLKLGTSDRVTSIYYSYDFTISGLAVATGGAHEIGLSMYFNGVKLLKRNTSLGRRRSIHCPDFDGPGFMPRKF